MHRLSSTWLGIIVFDTYFEDSGEKCEVTAVLWIAASLLYIGSTQNNVLESYDEVG